MHEGLGDVHPDSTIEFALCDCTKLSYDDVACRVPDMSRLVVYAYLGEGHLARMQPLMLQLLLAGARIVTYDARLPAATDDAVACTTHYCGMLHEYRLDVVYSLSAARRVSRMASDRGFVGSVDSGLTPLPLPDQRSPMSEIEASKRVAMKPQMSPLSAGRRSPMRPTAKHPDDASNLCRHRYQESKADS